MRKQGDGARENLHFELNDVNLKVVQGIGGSQTLTFRGNYYSEDSNVTYSGLRQDEYLADPARNPFQQRLLLRRSLRRVGDARGRAERQRRGDDEPVLELVPAALVAAVEQLGAAAERRRRSRSAAAWPT